MRSPDSRCWTVALATCMFSLGARGAWGQTADSTKAGAPVTTRSGVYAADQAANGKNIFLASCQSCHAISEINDGLLWGRWVGQSVNTIYSYLRENMPQDNPGSLAEDDYAKVTAYILQLNQMPAGTKPLPTDSTALKLIQVVKPDTTKPPPAPRSLQGARK